ncbi:Exosome complex component RRP4 [Thelohanellus kitauei]|uniref:Exosome complex component RRP4 n=1 Tax=Thelohanellus kitauei TaxID=669202 RepID=A0A0C2M1K9_THEKT|nr:Exosome complex component RRP4 [Thelohanellus kitauei]
MFPFSVYCDDQLPESIPKLSADRNLVLPSDFLTEREGVIRGYNTYEDKSKIYSSVLGFVEQIDRLVCVNPIKSRYQPSIGDVVIGRVLEVTYKKWVIDIGAKQNAVLLLCSVILPGAEQRKKTHEDIIQMSKYLSENDLILAEVQTVHSDGTPSLHMRSSKYGKLPVGLLIKVHHGLIQKSNAMSKMHDGIIILSSNGWIWIGPPSKQDLDLSFSLFPPKKPNLEPRRFEAMARYRNIIQVLSDYNIPIERRTIETGLELSSKYSTQKMLCNEISNIIARQIISKMSE